MQKIIAANWKMYKTRPEAAQTVAELTQALAGGTPHDRLVLIFPPFTSVDVVAAAFPDRTFIPSNRGPLPEKFPQPC